MHALAQRRDAQGDAVEAEVQVAPEAPGGDLGLQIAVGGRQEAHVDGPRLQGADAEHLPLLEHPQQLRLERDRHLADLVEEDGPALRRLEQAWLALRRPRERAALEAEQLALEQRLGQGRAVDAEQRRVGARRALVQPPRHDLLADAGLSQDEHVDLAGGDPIGHPAVARARDALLDHGLGLGRHRARRLGLGAAGAPLHVDADLETGLAEGISECVTHSRGLGRGHIEEQHVVQARSEGADHVAVAQGLSQGPVECLGPGDLRHHVSARRRRRADDGAGVEHQAHDGMPRAFRADTRPFLGEARLEGALAPYPHRCARRAALHDEHRRPDGDHLAHGEIDRDPRLEAASADERPVGARLIDELGRSPHAQPRVVAGCLRIVDAHVAIGGATYRDLARLGQRERENSDLAHDEERGALGFCTRSRHWHENAGDGDGEATDFTLSHRLRRHCQKRASRNGAMAQREAAGYPILAGPSRDRV